MREKKKLRKFDDTMSFVELALQVSLCTEFFKESIFFFGFELENRQEILTSFAHADSLKGAKLPF